MAMRRYHTNDNEDESRNGRIEFGQNSFSFDDAESLDQSILQLNLNDQIGQSRIRSIPSPIADLVSDDDSNSDGAYLTAEDTDGEIEYEEHIEEVGSPNSSTLEASRVLQLSSSPQSSGSFGLFSNAPDVSRQMDNINSGNGTSSLAPTHREDLESGLRQIHMVGSSTRPHWSSNQRTESINPLRSTTLGSLARMEETFPSSHVLPNMRRYDQMYISRPLHDYGRGQMSGVRSLSQFPRQPPSLGARGTPSTERWLTNPNRPTTSLATEHDQETLFAPHPGLTLFGHISDTLEHVQARPRNLGFNDDNSGPSNYQYRYQPGRFGVPRPHMLEMMSNEINTSRQTFEVPVRNANHPPMERFLFRHRNHNDMLHRLMRWDGYHEHGDIRVEPSNIYDEVPVRNANHSPIERFLFPHRYHQNDMLQRPMRWDGSHGLGDMIVEPSNVYDEVGVHNANRSPTERFLFRHRYQDDMFQHPIRRDDVFYGHRDMRVEPPPEPSNLYGDWYQELFARIEGTGLAEEAIMANLRQRDYRSRNREPSADVEICPICREDYADRESIGILDCNHEFHTHCITTWLKRKNQCPICKMQALDCSQS